MTTKTAKKKKQYEGEVPFGGMSGNFQSYPQNETEWLKDVPADAPWNQRSIRHEPKWVPNSVFAATLRVVDFTRGRSAARLVLEDVNEGTRYEMFMSDVTDMLRHANIVDGQIAGDWTFCKRGSNYGLRAVVDG